MCLMLPTETPKREDTQTQDWFSLADYMLFLMPEWPWVISCVAMKAPYTQ